MTNEGGQSTVADQLSQVYQHQGSIHFFHHRYADVARSDNYSNICSASQYIYHDRNIDTTGFDCRADILYDDTG